MVQSFPRRHHSSKKNLSRLTRLLGEPISQTRHIMTLSFTANRVPPLASITGAARASVSVSIQPWLAPATLADVHKLAGASLQEISLKLLDRCSAK